MSAKSIRLTHCGRVHPHDFPNATVQVPGWRIGARVDLKKIDHYRVDLIARDGLLSPSALVDKAKLYPATMTDALDRVERAGLGQLGSRSDGPARRIVPSPRARMKDIVPFYSGMSIWVDEICADYSEASVE
ncbi:MarR family transcriptional regulator [Rhizobium leucaenae]|uniref:MarR family transcriptional regulator n=1 Tax=Rhizobium leucaenae TaxID=29450 RepID=UPI001615422B|nr:MarR family transcriptional regulator [Rhizobium leucaenae]MBB6305059.1 hypothetical protein [Rhizobium leucaenae]